MGPGKYAIFRNLGWVLHREGGGGESFLQEYGRIGRGLGSAQNIADSGMVWVLHREEGGGEAADSKFLKLLSRPPPPRPGSAHILSFILFKWIGAFSILTHKLSACVGGIVQ